MLDSLVEVKSSGEESEVEELGAPNRPETNVLMSPDERESEGETGEQIDQGHVSVPEEEMLVGEGGSDQEEEHDGDAEEEGEKEEGQSLPGGEEEEISDQQDATLGVDEVSGSEQREIEGESEEDVAESVTDQEVSGKLLEVGYEDMGEKQEEEGEEVPDADERELEKGTLEGVIAEGQVEADELVEVQQAEVHVLTENEVGKAALGHTGGEVLVESSEEMTILDKGGVASGVNQGKRGSEVYQREVESVPTEEDATAGYGQESEGLIGASRRETGQVNGKEDVAPFVSQGKALEDQENLREAESHVPTAVGQRDTEVLSGATQGEVGQITNDVAPAADQGQECSEDLTKTQSQGVVEREAAAMAEEVAPLARASKTQISEEASQKGLVLVLGQVEACKTRGTDDKEGYRDVVLGENQGRAEELVGANEGLLEEVVTSIVDSALAVVEQEAGTSVGIGEGVPGKGSMSLMGVHGEVREGTSRGEGTLAADQQVAPEAAGPQERIPGAQEDAPRRGVEEISAQDQDEGGKEKIKPRISQAVGELSGPEEVVAEGQRGLDQGERKQLESMGTFPGELSAEGRVASTEDQQGAKGFVVLYQDQTVTDVTEKAPSQYQQDVGKGKMPSQEKTLAWSSELDDKMARSSLRMAEEQGRPESSVERRSVGDQEPPCRGKGKRIKGLAGLRQGPILTVPRRGTQSVGGIGGVLEHVAPGLIVTSLTAQAEQKGLVKRDQKQLSRGTLEPRATRSAEPGLRRPRAEVGERVVLMGYRIGREGMSCFSEADNRMAVFQQGSGQEAAAFQQAGEASDVGKRPDLEQTESPKQEEVLKEEKPLGSQIAGLEGQCLEELRLAWLGRPLSRSYAASQPASGWTAGLGPGHGLAPGSLRAAIKERIDMMVVGHGVSKSAGQSPEPPDPFGTGGRMSGLAGKPENVHWLQEVLGSGRKASPLSVAGRSPYSKEGSPELTAERPSPGLLTGKRELKDWRDGVMGIAIKRYNAMRAGHVGGGPVWLTGEREEGDRELRPPSSWELPH
ncbi:hypothetical protein JRQ81_006046 [Phrynocephalus forsythii]|uniref:Uncharacterized protein n=1 Tax=Phrynocephalus forsythii TaxID=171643 RepID=A0A9Q0XK90_9SAUR|nr:hypothetical protein JRQ81_006046 [Phrynocephalus forsythii]